MRYFTIDGLISAEMGFGGGAPSQGAINGALRRAVKCIRLMGKHVIHDADSNRLTFRRVLREEISDYTTKHTKDETERKQPKTLTDQTAGATMIETPIKASTGVVDAEPPSVEKPTADGAGGGGGESGQTRAAAKTASAKATSAKSKAKAKGQANGKAKSKAKGAKKPVDSAAVKRKAVLIASQFHQTIRRGNNRVHEVETQDAWEWARNEKFVGKLKKAMTKAKDSLDGFPDLFNHIEHGNDITDAMCNNASTSIEKMEKINEHLDDVVHQTKRLKDLHEQEPSASQ